MAISKKPKKHNPQALIVENEKGKSEHRRLAEIKLSSSVLNTLTTEAFTKSLLGEIDFTEAVVVMKEKTEKIIAGDLSELESTLAAQVVSLNAIFTSLARRSMNCEYLNQVEANLRLALKAQAQCARSIEVLAALKNPPIVFAKQANIANGHQQINNNQSPTHAEKTIKSSNELLSEADNAPLDTRGTPETIKINQELAAVETVDGGEDT
ncbi:MAG: hypothetical protein U1D41_08130 [Nitrosomonas sp.]|uniref:hypothetical protein n=1 Tax=Nitrosomonas sp. TaxID=42353 RepID=UPI00273386D4|nr:hypothetical protein [Nitrosomonas sp.]MDP3663994.1 hypothetical protein [Nitrosomonas sp.]MDZ4106115.1 hypothetical protein [Nitrosomonas sp.]